MPVDHNSKSDDRTSRRSFLKSSAAALTAGSLVSGLSPALYASGNEELRVGLIGCGGRGTGAATQALSADPNAKLVAMADAFADRLEGSLKNLKSKSDLAERVVVDDGHKFSGFDAYKRLIDCVDVVLMASPPHFRPRHLRAAVEAGKHCFVEKPVAVDAPGVRSVMATCELAQQKGLSIVSGLCWRYHSTILETFQRIHEGAIGDLVAMQCSYDSQGVWDPRRTREQCESDMEYQMRNWYYYTWLSGDHIVEQHIHSLDKMQWAMHDEPPVKVSGSGGRQQRTDAKYGNIYDHFAIVYEYANGVKAFSRCRHWRGCPTDVSDQIMGTKGVCRISSQRTKIEGETEWQYEGPPCNMYQAEHDKFFASIRAGKPIHNGDYMCKSTMMAIMGRMAAYTGKTITWEQALNSQDDLSPSAYEWGPLESRPVSIPGVTPFV